MVKISQIPYKSYICQSIRQYLLSDSCSNKESDTREFWLSPQLRCFAACSGFQRVGPATRNLLGDGRFAYTHSCAASQLAVGFGRSVPLCGTCGEMGGLLIPTAALLSSLQWVSDGRSRVAEHMGEMRGLLCHVCAALCHVWAAQCPGGTRLYETHCKLRSSAAVGISVKHHHTCSPKGDV